MKYLVKNKTTRRIITVPMGESILSEEEYKILKGGDRPNNQQAFFNTQVKLGNLVVSEYKEKAKKKGESK